MEAIQERRPPCRVIGQLAGLSGVGAGSSLDWGVHCRMSIASLASLPVPCEKHLPQLWGAKVSLDTASCPLGDEIAPMGEPLPSMDSSIKKQM